MKRILSNYWPAAILIASIVLAAMFGCSKPEPHPVIMKVDSNRPSIPSTTPQPLKDDSPACMCNPGALKQAVLDRIWDVGIGKGIFKDEQEDSDHLTLVKLGDAQRLIDKLRRYADSLSDHCLKDGYANWISFYQSQHDEGMDALNHPEAHKKDTSAEDKEKKKAREVEECKRKGTVPRIPSGAL